MISRISDATFICLSTDDKPVANIRSGTEFYEADTGKWFVFDGSAYQPSYGRGLVIDHSADIEISGEAITNRRYNNTSSGAETVAVLSVDETQRIKLCKAFLSVSADVAGEFKLLLGAKEIAGIYAPKAGGLYMFLSASPDYELGEANEDLTLSVPAAATYTVNVSYVLEDV